MVFKTKLQNMKYIIILLFSFIIISSLSYVYYNKLNEEGFNNGNFVNTDELINKCKKKIEDLDNIMVELKELENDL